MRLLKDKFEVLRDGNSPESGETPMPLGGGQNVWAPRGVRTFDMLVLGPLRGQDI